MNLVLWEALELSSSIQFKTKFIFTFRGCHQDIVIGSDAVIRFVIILSQTVIVSHVCCTCVCLYSHTCVSAHDYCIH